MSAKTQPKANSKNQPNLKPRPLAHARDVALLDLAVAILTGYEVHVMQAGQRYAVIGDDNCSIVALRRDAAACLSCKKPCLHAELLQQERHRLVDLGAKP